MNTTTPTWRDLRDQLTPDQIAYLEGWEARPHLPVMADSEWIDAEAHQRGSLLFAAQEFAETNKIAEQCVNLPMPPDARVIDGWHRFGEGEFDRYFDGTTRRDDSGVRVFISGRQMHDGRIEREITLAGRPDQDDRLSADDARAAARMLIEAADELDRLDGGYPVDSATRKCCGGIGRHTPDC